MCDDDLRFCVTMTRVHGMMITYVHGMTNACIYSEREAEEKKRKKKEEEEKEEEISSPETLTIF